MDNLTYSAADGINSAPLFTPRTPRTQPRLRPKSPAVAVRNVRFSAEEEAKLQELQQLLSGSTPDDSPSVSLLVRTSVGEYLMKLLSIKANNPAGLEVERTKLANNAKRIVRGKRRQAHRR
jgi:hypothetical protein